MPIKHEWNGTILTITSDSGTSSADLKGAKGDDGARGIAGAAGGTCYNVFYTPTNLLDNSYFLNPINQRGQATYTGNVYTIDRWRTYSSTAEVEVNKGYITLKTSALLQYLDIKPDITYTAAVKKLDGTIVIASGNFTTGFSSGGIRCAVVNGYCRFLIDEALGANGIVWAALYEGTYTADTLPEYHYKGYAAELLECQRYYIKIATQPVNGWCYSWGRITVFVPLPVKMRTTNPTITPNTTAPYIYVGSTAYSATYGSGTSVDNGIVIYYTHEAAINGQCVIPEFAAEIVADL